MCVCVCVCVCICASVCVVVCVFCVCVCVCVRVCLYGRGVHFKVSAYYHLNIFLIMTITCSRSELSNTRHQAGAVDSYLETQCTEQFAALSQTNWIWATLDWAPDCWAFGPSKRPTEWLSGSAALHITVQHARTRYPNAQRAQTSAVLRNSEPAWRIYSPRIVKRRACVNMT